MGRGDISPIGGSIARAVKMNRKERGCALSWPAECGVLLCRAFARPEACFGIGECIPSAAGVNISASRSIVFGRNEPAAAGWGTLSALSVLDKNRTLYAPGRENTSSKRGKHQEGRERVHHHRREHPDGRQAGTRRGTPKSARLTQFTKSKNLFFKGKYI